MNIRFYFEKGKTYGMIRLRISKNGNNHSFGTNHKIKNKDWDSKSQSPKANTFSNNKIIRWQRSIRNVLEKLYDDMTYSDDYNFSDYKTVAGKLINGSDYNNYKDLLDHKNGQVLLIEGIDEYIDYLSKSGSRGTIGNITTLKKHLIDFEKLKQTKFKYNDVNYKFMVDFGKHLTNKKNSTTGEYGLKLNTVANNLEKLKMYMNWSKKIGYHKEESHKEYTTKTEDTMKYALSPDDLQLLLNYKYDSIRLSEARDIFCFMCLTGQRYNVIKSMTWSQVDLDTREFVYRDVKTKSINKVVLVKPAYNILQKYKELGYGYPLPRISPQKLNKNIKKLAGEAGLKRMCKEVFTQGGRLVENEKPFNEMMSTHTGRRTFASIASFRRVPDNIAQKATGHKNNKTYRLYVKDLNTPDHDILDEAFNFNYGGGNDNN